MKVSWQARQRPRRLLALALMTVPAAACAPGPTGPEPPPSAAERDATISELRGRLERLQQRLDALEQRSTAAPPAAAAPSSQPPAGPAEGQLSQEEIGRALEATLIRRGALVLPPWSLQATPEIFYAHQRTSVLALVPAAGATAVAMQDVRTDIGGADLALRLGLPWDTQAEFLVPYLYGRQRVVIGDVAQTFTTSGIGDVQVGLSKQLLYERDWVPGLLASFYWLAPTGKTAPLVLAGAPAAVGSAPLVTNVQRLSLGSGFNSFTGALTATKRQDPLVFFGGASYTANLSTRQAGVDLKPGDAVAFDIGSALAVSPTTSLLAGFDVGFASESKVNGAKVPGSDLVIGIVEVRAATVLSPHVVVDAGLGFGVTQSAPDFVFSLSLPFRF